MIPTREEIERIRNDVRATMLAAEKFNIEVHSLMYQKVKLLPTEEQSLYWDIFLYELERRNERPI